MSWQEPIVAVIVGLAVVSLYRHLRELVGSAAPDAQASCHGCDDCAAETDAVPPQPTATADLHSQSTQIH
jgi:hypothetical protein